MGGTVSAKARREAITEAARLVGRRVSEVFKDDVAALDLENEVRSLAPCEERSRIAGVEAIRKLLASDQAAHVLNVKALAERLYARGLRAR